MQLKAEILRMLIGVWWLMDRIQFRTRRRFNAHYNQFQERVKQELGNIDGTYGVKGSATPLSGEMLERFGIIPKY